MLSSLALVLMGQSPTPTEYFGVYYAGVKAGHVVATESPGVLDGKPAVRRRTHTEAVQVAGGVPEKVAIDDAMWLDADNHPLRHDFVRRDSTGTTKVRAVFGAGTVEVDTEKGGKKTHRSVPLPKEEVLEDEARIVRDRLGPGKTLTFAKFSADDAGFETATLACVGPTTYRDGGRTVSATLSELTMGGHKGRLFTDAKGALVRIELGGGLVVEARAKEAALAPAAKTEDQPDQILIHSLHTTTPIENATNLRELKLRFRGEDLSTIPSDEFQTVKKEGDGWIVHVHPPAFAEAFRRKIGEGTSGQEAWLKSSPSLSCDDPLIRAAAKKAVGKGDPGGTGDSVGAAIVAIRKDVSRRMKPKMEFGDVRDAVDILKNPHGKCVEYAVLTTAMLRAAGIPSRLASGLVTGNGTFFYHAWSEAWDGRRWLGVDAALEMEALPACYVKLAHGDVKEGFKIVAPNDPSEVTIDVLSVVR